MMKCVFVCHEKSSLSTSELSAGGAKWLPARPCLARLWPSDDDDNDAVFNRRAGYLDRHQVEMQLKREQAAKVERVRYLR